MGYAKLKLSKGDPPAMAGYSIIGWFDTFKEAEDWYKSSRKAGKTYPFWCNRHKSTAVGEYRLWWMKPKGGGKMKGKGWS
jgi:hypothetical protein